MEEVRILFTGVGRRIELIQAFRQAALVKDIKLIIYGADMAGTAPALNYCDYARKVCGMKDANYIDELIAICKNDSIDILIPTIDTDLLVLSNNKDKFEQIGTKVLISALDKITICRDKNNTSQFFVDCGLKAPLPVNDYTKYDMGFPAFIKPKDGSSSINAFKVENEEELEVYAAQVDDYIVQPFVDGKEYTIDIFCDFDGNPIYIIPRERMQVRAGEVLKTQIYMDKVMIEEGKILCNNFKPCGPMTVQLIQDKDTGDNYYIEINPRFGGGAPLSMKAGARSAEDLLDLIVSWKNKKNNEDRTLIEGVNESINKALHEYVCNNVQISDGAIYSRFDQSVCIDAGSNPEQVKGVIFDLDDTLYSEKEYVRSGYREVAKFLGNDSYLDRLWEYFEQRKPAIDCLLEELNREGEKTKCLEIYRKHKPNINLYTDAFEKINVLKNKGVKVGIITDGRVEGQWLKIKALKLDELIGNENIIVTDELGGPQFRKPCDIAFRIMQRRWRLPFEQMMYIGDNRAKDFQACRQLGMQWKWFKNEDGIYYNS